MTPERFQRLQRILARRQNDLTVLMDRVHKPHNFAAVMRSCDAVGIGQVHLVPTDTYHPAHRNAMGATRYVDVRPHDTVGEALAELRRQGMTIVAAHPAPDSVDYRSLDYTRPTALLLGTELEGLDETTAEAADVRVVVPMRGAVASLNVSVAAAVILYEMERQRADAGRYDQPLQETEQTRRTLFEWSYPRIADLCRRRGVEYPEQDDAGEIVGELPR